MILEIIVMSVVALLFVFACLIGIGKLAAWLEDRRRHNFGGIAHLRTDGNPFDADAGLEYPRPNGGPIDKYDDEDEVMGQAVGASDRPHPCWRAHARVVRGEGRRLYVVRSSHLAEVSSPVPLDEDEYEVPPPPPKEGV